MYFSTRKATTAKISSHVCSARKPIALPAALKRKLTIEPIRPGRADAIFEPISFRPFPNALPVALKAFVIAPMTAPVVTPAARTIAVMVTPYFLNISFTLSRSGSALSLSSICVLKRASSSCLSATLPSAACLSEGEASSLSITA